MWSHVNYEHPYPERERKLELGEYSGRSKSQVTHRAACNGVVSHHVVTFAIRFLRTYAAAEPMPVLGQIMQPCLQVNDWFTNWRARVWKRDVNGHCGSLWTSAVTKVLALLRTVAWYRRVCKRDMLHLASPGVVVRQSLERLQTNS